MIPRNIFAFTPHVYTGHYPPYLSINYGDGETVEITVRSSVERGSTEAVITLPKAEFDKLREALT